VISRILRALPDLFEFESKSTIARRYGANPKRLRDINGNTVGRLLPRPSTTVLIEMILFGAMGKKPRYGEGTRVRCMRSTRDRIAGNVARPRATFNTQNRRPQPRLLVQ
jgi:hypothetical protein